MKVLSFGDELEEEEFTLKKQPKPQMKAMYAEKPMERPKRVSASSFKPLLKLF